MIDPFTPWQEDAATLARRTVGRDDEVRWLRGACEAYLAGDKPTWCLVTGPRGAGKSHLLQHVRGQLSDPGAVVWIGEDLATTSDPEALWATWRGKEDPWGWAPKRVWPARPLLFAEGLDRIVAALRPEGRWTLRHHLQESGAFLVGTALSATFAGSEDDAFFGQLDAWSLQPLTLEQVRTLYLRVSEEEPDGLPATRGRREALIRMTGGSPRAVITVADAVRGTRGDAVGAADGLLLAVQRLVTHYQQRFHDLPQLGQQVVQALARAPRELTAGEVQDFVGASSAAVSNVAKALEQAGALVRHPDAEDARITRYALAEPLFRYWLEYRTMPSWGDTRVAWLGKLLGEVLTRQDLADRSCRPVGKWQSEQLDSANATTRLYMKVLEAIWTKATDEIGPVLRRAEELSLKRWQQLDLLSDLARFAPTHVGSVRLRPEIPIARAIQGLASAVSQQRDGRTAFLNLIAVADQDPHDLDTASVAATLILDAFDCAGVPWPSFDERETALVSRVPYFRLLASARGRRPTDEPLLPWSAVVASTLRSSTPDLDDILALAHARQDQAFFDRVLGLLDASGRKLSLCTRPERRAPIVDSRLARSLARFTDVDEGLWGLQVVMSWGASLASLDDLDFSNVVTAFQPSGLLESSLPFTSAARAGALVLGVTRRDRFDRIASIEPTLFADLTRMLDQLEARADGPLHPELELVWQAMHPDARET